MPTPKNIDKQERITAQIVEFLKSRPLISIKGLEEKVGMPPTTIAKAVENTRFIPEKHLFSVIWELSYYGFQLDGSRIEADEETGTLFFLKFVENIETIEDDNSFAYIVKEYRYMATNYTDLFLKNE